MTGFTITDALDLEEAEPPLTTDTLDRMDHYAPAVETGRLFEKSDGTCNALYRATYHVDALLHESRRPLFVGLVLDELNVVAKSHLFVGSSWGPITHYESSYPLGGLVLLT